MSDQTNEKQGAITSIDSSRSQMVAAGETAASALATQAKAMIEARYVVALNKPRDLDEVREKLLKECRRPGFAAVARYKKPIGKDQSKWPAGPSIRFAEAAIRCMGNIVVETATIFDDSEKRIVRVSVTDLEANVPYSQDVTIHKTVERKNPKEGVPILGARPNSYGEMVYLVPATDDDILNKQNALISKALRTLGLRLIPGDIVDEAQAEIISTLNNRTAKDPDAERKRIFDAFGVIGIRVEQVKAYLGHDGVTLTPAELDDLRGLYAAIKDGETTWREIMDAKMEGQRERVEQGQQVTPASLDTVAANVEQSKAKKPKRGMPEPELEPEPGDDTGGPLILNP